METFRGPASETDGGRDLLEAFHEKHAMRIQTVGAGKGYFAKPFLAALFKRRVAPHVAAKVTGWEAVHQRVRRMSRTLGYHRSQRARKKIDELWGEAKCWHGFRRFRRRGLLQVRDEAYSDGVAAQFEETVDTDAGSGIAHGHAGAGRAGEGEKGEKGAGTLQHERELSKEITLYRHQRWSFLKQLFVNSLLAA